MIVFNIILILLFYWMNLYSLANLTKLEKRFYELDLESVGFKHYSYYVLRVSYFIWIVIGLFTSLKYYFLILLSLNIFKFLIYFVNKSLFKFFNVLNPFLVMIILSLLLFLNIKSFQIFFGYNNKLVTLFITPINHSFPFIFIFVCHF